MITTKDYRLNKMSHIEVEALWQLVKPVYEHHFGVDFGIDYLNKKCEGAHFARLRVMWNQQTPVGILLLFGHKIKVNNKNVVVYRGSAAIDKAFRSKNNLSSFMYRHVIGQILRYGFRKQYVIEGFIHPASYTVSQKNVARIYPSCDYATPTHIQQLIEMVPQTEILKGYDFVHENPFVADYPCNTVESSEEKARWQAKIKTDKHVAFYHQAGAMDHHRALVCIVPLNIKNLIQSLLKTRKNRAKHRAEKKQQQTNVVAVH